MNLLSHPLVKNITNERFGRLTVVKPIKRTKRGIQWACICDCGNSKIAISTDLRAGKTKSCGCLHRDMAKERASGKKVSTKHYVTTELYNRYKSNAKYRSLTFELPKDRLEELIYGSCYYCGSPPMREFNHYTNRTLHKPFMYNGIDRIDSSEGYINDNVVTCCFRCNMMKSNLSEEEFLKHIKIILEYRSAL